MKTPLSQKSLAYPRRKGHAGIIKVKLNMLIFQYFGQHTTNPILPRGKRQIEGRANFIGA
jgi:hypothetical protein